MTNWVMAGARTQPAVLALEDVHWADPTTLDFIRGIVERGALVPLLLLITLERLAEADILLVQGLPPESEYRQVLHRRVGEVLRDQFAASGGS